MTEDLFSFGAIQDSNPSPTEISKSEFENEDDDLEEIEDDDWSVSSTDVKYDLPVLVSTLIKKIRGYQNSLVHTIPLQVNQVFKPEVGRTFFTVMSLHFKDVRSEMYMFAKADPMTMLNNIYSSAFIPGYDEDDCFITFPINRLKNVTVLQTYNMSLSDANDFIENQLKARMREVSDGIFVKIPEI